MTSDDSDFPNDNLTPNDPFNKFVGNLGNLTNLDILITEALGSSIRLPIRLRRPAPRPI
jgi:hypothetical protein